jgi:hypothetical protein
MFNKRMISVRCNKHYKIKDKKENNLHNNCNKNNKKYNNCLKHNQKH